MLATARAWPRRALTLAAAALLAASFGCPRSRAADPCAHGPSAAVPLSPGPPSIWTVFLIAMENKNWSDIDGSTANATPLADLFRSYP